jgi:hypothetical protein
LHERSLSNTVLARGPGVGLATTAIRRRRTLGVVNNRRRVVSDSTSNVVPQ